MSYVFLRNEKEINDLIENVRYQLNTLNKENEYLRENNQRLRDEHYSEKELAEMSKLLELMRADYLRGFPITEAEEKKINNWILKHDEEVHGNPKHYHGASGGGYEYSFHPTGLGTIGYCICGICKSRGLREKGEKYWDYLKENNGYIEFGDFG